MRDRGQLHLRSGDRCGAGWAAVAAATLIAAGSAVAIDTMPGASTKPVVVPTKNRATALLTSVRAARHEGYDRVVFQVANTLPGYDVRYVERPGQADSRTPLCGL